LLEKVTKTVVGRLISLASQITQKGKGVSAVGKIFSTVTDEPGKGMGKIVSKMEKLQRFNGLARF
jgi:hypothetical protein